MQGKKKIRSEKIKVTELAWLEGRIWKLSRANRVLETNGRSLRRSRIHEERVVEPQE